MFVYTIDEPNNGLSGVLEGIKQHGIEQQSRNGPVLRFPRPVCLEYLNPTKRLLTSAVRDANPVFHLVETMWMFGGLNQLAPLLPFNAGMAQYSDDGKALRGTAYGYRWRKHWGDQIDKVVATLKANPDDRRCVMTMWDPFELGTVSKDFACNLQVIFTARKQHDRYLLDMTVTNRSNDLIYGAMGSNMFHFSMLLEYVAHLVGMGVGSYYQISSNLHVYTENPVASRCLAESKTFVSDEVSEVKDTTLQALGLTQQSAPIADFVMYPSEATDQPYLKQVVLPLVEAYRLYKVRSRLGIQMPAKDRLNVIREYCNACASKPLGAAALQWFTRKLTK